MMSHLMFLDYICFLQQIVKLIFVSVFLKLLIQKITFNIDSFGSLPAELCLNKNEQIANNCGVSNSHYTPATVQNKKNKEFAETDPSLENNNKKHPMSK